MVKGINPREFCQKAVYTDYLDIPCYAKLHHKTVTGGSLQWN